MEPQWDRLAEAVRVRRTSRGWSQAAVTERGGPSDTLQNRIEAGRWKPVRGVEDSLRKIDAGMEWRPGSASRILSGGEPIELDSSDDDRSVKVVQRLGEGTQSSADERDLVQVDLTKVIDALNLVYANNNKQVARLAGHPTTSPEERITLLEGALLSADAYAEFLIAVAFQNPDPRTREQLGEVFAARMKVENSLSQLMGHKEILKKRGPGAIASSQHIGQDFPPEVLSTYTAAGSTVSASMTAISAALSDQKPVTTSMTRRLLTAIDDYASAARRVVAFMPDNGIGLTHEEVEAALPFFETANEYVSVVLEFLDILAPGAPNAKETAEVDARQQTLEALSNYLSDMLDAWSNPRASDALVYDFSRARLPVPPPPALDELDVAASRREKQSDADHPEVEQQGVETKASRSGVSRVRRNVPDLTVDEFLPGGVDPTSPGDEQADHG